MQWCQAIKEEPYLFIGLQFYKVKSPDLEKKVIVMYSIVESFKETVLD